jgi:hypothetical protein
MYHQIPNQRVSISQKGTKWKKECMDAFLNMEQAVWSDRRSRLKRLYDYYNGVIDNADYNYVLKPYGKTRQNFPSKLRNYNIIKPTIDLLLGEKAKRPFNYSVVALNSDAVDRKEQSKSQFIMSMIEQGIVNELNAAGIDTGEESQEIPMTENMKDMFERSYVDNEAILGQKGLTYITQSEEVHDKLQKAWFHFLVSGECYSERTVRNNEVNYDILNPLDIDYDLDPDLDFVEESDWCIITRYMGPSAIVRNWGRFLDKDQMESLWSNRINDSMSVFSASNHDRNALSDTLIRVRTVYWQSLKRIGFLTMMDPETGSMETTEVSDGFVLPKEMRELGARLEWEWHNQPWQGIRIGDDIDIDVRQVSSREFIDNPSKLKLPVNGRRYSDINSQNISLIELGVPFQLNYNIYKYRLETSIARSKDIIAQLDINLIPKNWDMDKFMYFVEGTGIAWVDYNKEGVKLSPQHQSVMDLSVKTIQLYITLLEHIQFEWENLSGVNSQRRGEVGQYQGKAMGQQAIIQSSHSTEDLFRKFAQFERRDLQMLLEISKDAWKNGKKGTYLMPDGSVDYFQIDPDNWQLSDLGVFVTDATKEVEKMNNARELAHAMIQNGGSMSQALDMIEGESFAILKEKINKAEKQSQELMRAQSQAEQESIQKKDQINAELREREIGVKEQDLMLRAEDNEKDRQLQRELKIMEIQNRPQPQDTSGQEILKQRELQEKERANRAQESIKMEDIRSKEKIAKEKPKPTTSK